MMFLMLVMLGVFGNEFGLNIGWHRGILGKSHGELGFALRERAQGGGVLVQFLERHFGFD